MKIKKLKGCLNVPVEKFVWTVPVMEVLIYLPLFLFLYQYPFLILYFDFPAYCAFGKMLLEIAIIKKSIIFFCASLFTFGAKIVSAFFMIKKSKWGFFYR